MNDRLLEDLLNLPVDRLSALFFEQGRPLPNGLLGSLGSDPRRAARELAKKLRARARRNLVEGQRLRRLLRFEVELWQSGLSSIAGVDEAGMAPLAGPVVAGAVI